jgi:hypothetical protein
MTTEALTPNSWGAGFALAEAFDLGVELPPALALLLRMDSLGAGAVSFLPRRYEGDCRCQAAGNPFTSLAAPFPQQLREL